MKAFKRCLSSAEARPHQALAAGKFGNNDPAENFEKRDVRHAVRAENSEGVEGLGTR